MRYWISVVWCLVVVGCGSSTSGTHRSTHMWSAPTSAPPKLVVALVIDQLGTQTLQRYLPYLSPDGAIRRGIQKGVFHKKVVYPYAGTFTAAGHATIHTGVCPVDSGVALNDVWSRELHRTLDVCDDQTHPILGNENKFASPSVLQVDTVGDVLKKASGGKSRVASLAMKVRSSVVPGGHKPDLVMWFDEKVSGFTTSTYYSNELPTWVSEWQVAHPVNKAIGTWVPSQPDLYARLLGPDEQPGESGPSGFTSKFPHTPLRADDSFLVTPQSTMYMLSLAEEIVHQLDMGRDDSPDFLALSISTTDITGHWFGPDSWEYLDHLIAIDRALGEFLSELESHTPTAVLITSDHGVAPLVEHTLAQHKLAGRIPAEDLVKEAETAADREVGEGTWIDGSGASVLYFTEAARSEKRPKIMRAVLHRLREITGIANAFDIKEVSRPVPHRDPIEAAVALSISSSLSADVYVVPSPYYVIGKQSGTNHGSPWPYDTEVFTIFWGPGMSQASTQDARDIRQVAPTLASMLRVAPPIKATFPPLPGITAAQ